MEIAHRIKLLRLEQNLTQQGLCDRSDVTLPSLRRFERTGLIAFDSLLRLVNALGDLMNLKTCLFKSKSRTLFSKKTLSLKFAKEVAVNETARLSEHIWKTLFCRFVGRHLRSSYFFLNTPPNLSKPA